jgi:hypothetical protein
MHALLERLRGRALRTSSPGADQPERRLRPATVRQTDDTCRGGVRDGEESSVRTSSVTARRPEAPPHSRSHSPLGKSSEEEDLQQASAALISAQCFTGVLYERAILEMCFQRRQ